MKTSGRKDNGCRVRLREKLSWTLSNSINETQIFLSLPSSSTAEEDVAIACHNMLVSARSLDLNFEVPLEVHTFSTASFIFICCCHHRPPILFQQHTISVAPAIPLVSQIEIGGVRVRQWRIKGGLLWVNH
jgi:hypothetical protein